MNGTDTPEFVPCQFLPKGSNKEDFGLSVVQTFLAHFVNLNYLYYKFHSKIF